jgi:hypothetical protein
MGNRWLLAVFALMVTFGLGQTSAQAQTEGEAAGAPVQEAQPASAPTQEAAPMPTQEPPTEPEPAPNAIFLEGGGPGLWYSLNYERHVNPDLAVRVGFSYMSFSATASSGDTTASASAAFLTFPITVAYVGVPGLEVGGGATITYVSGAASTGLSSASGSGMVPLGNVFLGYRSHPMGGAGFQFRIGIAGLIGKGLSLSADDPEAIGIIPTLYLSLGAGF